VLDDAAADFEIGHHLKRIHHRRHATPGGVDEVADFDDERGKIAGFRFCASGSFGRDIFIFHGQETSG
jgi:hypothetical protein